MEGYTAVLGGSFDPIHLGHLHIATQALLLCRLTRVLFVPNGKHHFKADKVRLGYSDRYSLVERAIAHEPHFEVSDADQAGSGYTAHLMQKLSAQNTNTRFAFIIGSDNLPNLDKWFDFPWLAANLHFLVVPRPGYEIPTDILPSIKASLLPIELSPISSTEVKCCIDSGRSISGLVPPSLEEDIIRLYHNS
ncbi:MAG: nicotinate (nicotinamide) nucleotide adenylyltransferase [Candidatus Cloacimonetes bacterium HGW-Cloacimonetes-3]|nr:MAG: nicotinate (nicotinamide) nucleotide adenylyltransferase [Candidatus Cloacimonetes bacterium HGW-Cloacimonetes-3]